MHILVYIHFVLFPALYRSMPTNYVLLFSCLLNSLLVFEGILVLISLYLTVSYYGIIDKTLQIIYIVCEDHLKHILKLTNQRLQ